VPAGVPSKAGFRQKDAGSSTATSSLPAGKHITTLTNYQNKSQ